LERLLQLRSCVRPLCLPAPVGVCAFFGGLRHLERVRNGSTKEEPSNTYADS
jgi:hypothetical protein